MKNIIFYIVLACSISSCFYERIDPDYNVGENKKLVITAWISNLDEPHFVSISNTVNYLGDLSEDKVSGATVSIADEQNAYTLFENETGKYFLPDTWEARVGDRYTLTVNYNDKTYTAEHIMRACPEIEEVGYQETTETQDEIEIVTGEDGDYIYETFFSFQEIEGEGDAYYGVDYLKGTLDGEDIQNGGYADDSFVDGLYFEEVILSDGDRLYAIGDTAVLELHSIGLETANFLQDIENEIYRGSPFDAPPANVRTNITGGAIGYFIMAAASKSEIIID